MLTGDYPPHDVWLQSRENNKRHSKMATDLVKKYFPDSTVVVDLGNHESFPCNRFLKLFVVVMLRPTLGVLKYYPSQFV